MDIEEYKKKVRECDDPSEMLKVWDDYRKDINNAEERDAVSRFKKYSVDNEYFESVFKKYLTKDTLKVMDEAIPMVLGVLPSDWFKLRAKFNYGHHIFEIIDSDRYGSLKVINEDKRKGYWRVNTKEFFKWADAKGLIKAKGLVEALKNAKGLSNPKGTAKGSKLHGNTKNNALAREEVYKSALAVMKHFPEQCISERKKEITASQVATVIDEKALMWWPEEGKPPLARGTVEKLLQSAFKLPE